MSNMAKCTLRKVSEGILATIKQRPKVGDNILIDGEIIGVVNEINTFENHCLVKYILPNNNTKYSTILLHRANKIIASTIPNLGKELVFTKIVNELNILASENFRKGNYSEFIEKNSYKAGFNDGYIYMLKEQSIGKEYDYTETETQVIIEL